MTFGTYVSRKKTGMATAALVLGIASFFCLGPLAGVPAIILGAMAMSRVNRDPAAFGGHGVGLAGVITGAVGTLVGTGLAAIMFAIFLPSFSLARELSNRSFDASSLRQIGSALQVYANDNRNHFPPELAAAASNLTSPRVFVSKDTTTTPPAYTPPITDWTPLIPEINDHTDWTYACPNEPDIGDPQVILAYSKDIYSHHGGRNILFMDGHVEFVPAANLQACFDANNAARERNHLPSIALDMPVSPMAADMPTPAFTHRPAFTAPPRMPVPSPTADAPPLPPATRALSRRIPHVSSASEALADLRTTDPQLHRAAFLYLRRTKPDANAQKEVNPVLVELLSSPTDQRLALLCLETWGTSENAPSVLTWMKALPPGTDKNNDRNAAFNTLGKIGNAETADQLEPYLSDPATRLPAGRALREIGPAAQRTARDALRNSDPEVQIAACEILHDIGTAESLPDLQRLVDSDNHGVAFTADNAIKAINIRAK